MTIWKPVPGSEGQYEVSDDGQVRSLDHVVPRVASAQRSAGTKAVKGRVLRPGPSNYGHLSVVLGRSGGTRMVHALVLEAFVGPRPPGMECRHLDGDPKNNRLENLCWGTRTENIEDALRHGSWFSEKRKQHLANMALDPKRKEYLKRARFTRWYRATFGDN
jgi:hypothetical protein